MAKKVYCVGDYISQIGRIRRSYKGKPNINKVYTVQNFLCPQNIKYRVNNVLFPGVLYIDKQEKYIGLVCQIDIEKAQKLCGALNRAGDAIATHFDMKGRIVIKISPIRFVQLSEIFSDNRMTLKIKNYRITI